MKPKESPAPRQKSVLELPTDMFNCNVAARTQKWRKDIRREWMGLKKDPETGRCSERNNREEGGDGRGQDTDSSTNRITQASYQRLFF